MDNDSNTFENKKLLYFLCTPIVGRGICVFFCFYDNSKNELKIEII